MLTLFKLHTRMLILQNKQVSFKKQTELNG